MLLIHRIHNLPSNTPFTRSITTAEEIIKRIAGQRECQHESGSKTSAWRTPELDDGQLDFRVARGKETQSPRPIGQFVPARPAKLDPCRRIGREGLYLVSPIRDIHWPMLQDRLGQIPLRATA